jgi:hypothetical protein
MTSATGPPWSLWASSRGSTPGRGGEREIAWPPSRRRFRGRVAERLPSLLLGQRWGFLLALIASAPYWYCAILTFHWDCDLGFRRNTFFYWLVVGGLFPAFGVVEGVYCLVRLLG